MAPHASVKDAADLGFTQNVGFVGAGEGGEIVFADEHVGGGDHIDFIEWIGVVVNVALEEGGADFFAPDAVLVSFGESVEAGLEVEWSLRCLQDADVRRKLAIEGAAEIIGRDRVIEIEGGADGEGVNASVSATAAFEVDGFSIECAEDLLDGALDGAQAGLDLPAMIVGAVVADPDADAAHWLCGGS